MNWFRKFLLKWKLKDELFEREEFIKEYEICQDIADRGWSTGIVIGDLSYEASKKRVEEIKKQLLTL